MLLHKLQSKKGASLSMALLIFMVCVVTGAVVITAASAASGRVARQAEMDARYYNVSSAAELLSAELGDASQSLEVVRTREDKTITTTVYSVNAETQTPTLKEGPETVTAKDYPLYETKIGNYSKESTALNPIVSAMSFLTKETIYLLFGDADDWGTTYNTATAYRQGIIAHQEDPIEFTISLGENGPTAYASAQLRQDGALIIMISDGNDSDDDYYAVKLTLRPNVENKEVVGEPVVEGPDSVTTDDETIVTTTTTQLRTRTTTVTWAVTGMEKLRVKEASNG